MWEVNLILLRTGGCRKTFGYFVQLCAHTEFSILGLAILCTSVCQTKPNQTKVVKVIFLVHISKTGDAEDQWHLSGD